MRDKTKDAKELLELLLGGGEMQLDNPGNSERTLDVIAILSLPEHLRKTALAIHKMGYATAAMIAEMTGRLVDIETTNLVKLIEMGYLEIVQLEHEIFYKIRT